MDGNRISIYIRLACMTVAVVLPIELFAQRPSSTEPTRRRRPTRPVAVETQPSGLRMQPGQAVPPPPDIEQLRRLIRKRPARNSRTTTTTTTSPVVVNPARGPAAATTQGVSRIQESCPVPTTLPAGEKAIQFCFNNAPYSAVFDFIERISGLPILGDRNIQGTVTYFSRKKMTLNEALAELNLLLKQKDKVIVRTDDHLLIDKFPEVLRENIQDFVNAESFMKSDVSAVQVVRVFFRVDNLSAEELTNLLAEALPVNEVKLAAWRTTNQIQIVGLASQVRQIIELAKKLDTGLKTSEAGLDMRVFKPKFIAPTALERILRTMMPASGVVGPGNVQLGEPGAGGRANVIRGGEAAMQIAADDITGTLVVRGNSAMISQVEKITTMLDTQEEAGNIKAIRIPIEFGSVQTIEMVLNESIRQRAGQAGRGQMSLSVKGDEPTRTIVLAGARTLVDQAEQMIKLLDKQTVATRIKIIPLQAARADEIMRDVLMPFYRNARREVPATADMISNSIVTWATGSELDEMKDLLKQLDESAKEGKGVPVVRVYQMDEVDVNRLSGTLQQMYAKQGNITFGADPIARTLLVAGPVDKLERVEKTIKELKSTMGSKTITELVQLKYANAEQVAAAVRGTFQTRRSPTGEARVEISWNVQANTILASGSKSAVEEAVKIIKQLDEQIRTTNAIKSYPLKYAQADDLAKMIQDLHAGKDPTLKVVSDPWSNTLFISGGSGVLTSVEQLIKTADHPEPTELTSNNVAFITLKTASAEEVADQVSSMLSSGTTNTKNLPQIEASESGNYLIVTGQPKQIERVRQLAEQIDKMAQQVPEILAVRPIQKISAERLAQMLNVIVPQISGTRVNLVDVNMSNARSGWETFLTQPSGRNALSTQGAGPLVTIGLDKGNNTLIIRGKPKDIEEIDKQITNLTADVQADVQFKIYALKHASPSEVAVSLESLFNEIPLMGMPGQPPQPQPQPQMPQTQNQPGMQQQQRGRQQQQARQSPAGAARRIRAIPVEQTSSVVVRADPRDFQTVEEFILQLDQPDTETVKIYRLKYARADAVAKNIMDLFGGNGGGGGGRRFRAQMMAGMFPSFGGVPGQEMKISYDMTSNSIIVAGGRSKAKDIEDVIASLDKPEGAGMEVHILPLKTGKADQLAPMIQNVMQQAENTSASQRGLSPQAITISFDKRTNSLIVAGTTRQFEQVKGLVDRLESVRPSGGERRIFVVPLRNLDPSQAKQLLEQMLPPGQSSVWPRNQGLPGLREQAGFALYSVAMGQTTRRAKSPVTRPSSRSQRKSPLMGNDPEKAMKLAILQQMFKAQQTQPSQSRGKSSIVIMPTPTPFVTTTAPAARMTQESGKRFPKTIVQPGNVQGKAGTGAITTTAEAKELQALASKVQGNVEITAVPDQNALVIDATEQDYQVIEQLLGMIDQSRPTPRVEIFRLKNARATELAEVVGRLFANRPMPRGFPPITLTPDVASNSIIVSATPEILDEIRQMVTQLDAQEQIPQMDFRVYQLKNARASQLVPQLQTMLQQVMAARGIAQAPFSVTADDRTNTIIVTAPPTYLDQIGKLIQTMDTVPSFATAVLDIVRLKQADAEAVGKILSGLVSPGAKGAQTGPAQELLNRLTVSMEKAGEKGTLDLEKPIKYIPDRPSQSILVLSTPENNRILRQIITMLDKVPLAENLLVRIFALKHADAEDVRKALDSVFSKGQNLTKTPGTEHTIGVPENATGQALVYNVTIAADRASNMIIAGGSESSLALMEVLVRQLDQEQPATIYPIRTIGLANASAKDLSKLVEDMMTARANRAKALGANRAAEKASVVIRADERINMLLVSASQDDFDMICQLVKKLDCPPEAGATPTLIALKVVDAQTMAELLDKFFKERNQIKQPPTETKPAFPATTPVIIPEPRSNTLVVSAGKKTLEEIRTLVDRLDNAVITRRMQVAVIPLQSADASQLAQAITQLLNPTREQAGLKQAVILEFIRQTPEGKCLIQRALKDQIFIYGDKTSNLLLAVAPSDTICLIQDLVKTIDEVAPSVEIRVIALVNADAEQMQKIIEDLFGGGKGGGGNTPAVRFTTTGPAIEAAPTGGGEGSRTGKETLAVTSDTRTNSIIVSGTASYLAMVEKIIRELDAKAIEQQQTEVIPLKNAKADTVQKSIETLIQNRLKMWQEIYGQQGVAPERLLEQQVNIVADTDSRKVILQASPRYFTAVRRIIDELDQAPSQVMIQAMIVEVTLDGRIEYGFEAVGQDLSFTKNQTAPGIGPGHDVVVGTDVGASGGAGPAGFAFSLHGEDFNLLLRALNSDGKLQVLSRPQIMARDNAEAEIQIGQRVPFPTGSNISPDTGNVTTTIQYEDVGVILKVVPHINPEGYVILEVEPEISSISNSNVQISEGLSAPIFNKNSAKTIVTIKDGETVVIGGLITKSKNHTEVKVPFLGDIPILGLAFKSLVDVERRSELLIILTPRLVDSVERARALSAEERDLMELLPREFRESRLMGALQQTFDEEGFVVTTQPATTQPVTVQPGEEYEEIEVESGQRLFKKPVCNEQLLNAFKRTCDQ